MEVLYLILIGIVAFIVYMNWNRAHVSKEDCLNVLSYHEWKSVLQVLHALESERKGHIIIADVHYKLNMLVYENLAEREERNLNGRLQSFYKRSSRGYRERINQPVKVQRPLPGMTG